MLAFWCTVGLLNVFLKSDHRSNTFNRNKVMKSYGKQLLIIFKGNTVQLSVYLYSSKDSDFN